MSEPLLGTMEWCQRTGDRMSTTEKIELARYVASLKAEMCFDEMRHRLGLLRPAAVDLDTLAPPDTRLVRDAEAFGLEIYDESVLTHCLRTYYLGALVAAHDGIAFDREVFYAAAICHDAGLTAVAGPLSACCFAHASGRIARERLGADGHPDPVVSRIADAISTHLNLFVPPSQYPAESALTAMGATCDILGAYVHRIEPGTLKKLVERYPRIGFLTALARAGSGHHPEDTRPSVLLAMGAFDRGTQGIEEVIGVD
ncbi:HD domain-containing protein [Pendulispora albinea]|uniref:HD domain-containing protein n=1 Tax=Pendulispora albinea TaxID=2741071 RepID=A0ABZ2M9E7_9BACT